MVIYLNFGYGGMVLCHPRFKETGQAHHLNELLAKPDTAEGYRAMPWHHIVV